MCDNICQSEKKYALGPAPYFPPPHINSYPCRVAEVDTPIYEPTIKPVIKNIVQETTINVPKIQYREHVVEVPKVEYRPYPVVKNVETPIYQDKYKYKDVEVPQKQFRIKPIYKVIDVPEVEYVDKFVKKKYKRFKYLPKNVPIPFRPKKEIYEEVPVPRYIPQHMENMITPENGAVPHYTNQLPLYEGYSSRITDMLNPFKSFKKKSKNKCCLGSLFSKNDKSFEDPHITMPHPMFDPESQLYNIPTGVELYPPPPPPAYDAIGYSHPFVVEEEEKDFCNCLIETTSNVLAASGVALILAGKLTFDGINYLVKMSSSKDKSKDGKKEEIEDYCEDDVKNKISTHNDNFPRRLSERSVDDEV